MSAPSHANAPALALLDGLLVGAEQPMESADEWAARLARRGDWPLLDAFSQQLRAEWPTVEPPDPFCEGVRAHVRDRLSEWHPGWPHLWAHVQRVTATAVLLADEAGVEPALAYLPGVCHDVAKLDEYRSGEPHEQAGARFAGQVLGARLAPQEVAAIQAAILKQGDGALADILHDADKLDKIGAAGILRRVSVGRARDWLPSALRRVEDDAARFPAMRFDGSRQLARSKQTFQAWLLPQLMAVLP